MIRSAMMMSGCSIRLAAAAGRLQQHARKDTVTAPNGSESSNPVKPKLRSALSD